MSSSSSTSGLKNLTKEDNQNGQISIPSNYYVQNNIESIANNNGPILLFDDGKAFGATDWYGNLSWYVSLDIINGYYSSLWFTTSNSSKIDFAKAGTKVVDWAYNHSTDNLYVLTDSNYLIIIQSQTGQIVSANLVTGTNTKTSTSVKVNKIQIIDFNSSVYLWDSTQSSPTIYQVDPKTGTHQSSISSSETNSAIKDKYLFALIPLDVNYSIAVTSSNKIEESNQSSVTINLDLVIDKMVKLIPNTSAGKVTSNSIKNNLSITLTDSVSSKDIYTNAFRRNSDYVVFAYDKMYTLTLNKSSIEQSNFTEITEASSSGCKTNDATATSKGINSAYIDSSNQVYFKKDGLANISYIAINNNITSISLISSSNTGVFTNSNSEDAQNAQVFPIPISTSSSIVSNSFTGYVLSPTNFKGTGLKIIHY